MKQLPIMALLALSACAAPDRCWTEHETIKTCVELRKTDPRIHCECTTSTGESRDYAPAPAPSLPGGHDGGGTVVDHDDHSEDPDRDPATYDHWKETGVWPK